MAKQKPIECERMKGKKKKKKKGDVATLSNVQRYKETSSAKYVELRGFKL